MKKFIRENEKKLKEYGMLRKKDDSKKCLENNLHLVYEHTADYLVIWCIDLEMEEKHDLIHPGLVEAIRCVWSFSGRIQITEVEYKVSFDDELRAFKERIRKRAAEKIADAIKEAEEEERKARLGPGGLDRNEVFESLPEKCFKAQDIPLLQQTIAAMTEEKAKYFT